MGLLRAFGFIGAAYILALGLLGRQLLKGPRDIGFRPLIYDLFFVGLASVLAIFIVLKLTNRFLNEVKLASKERLKVSDRRGVANRLIPYCVLALALCATPVLLQEAGTVSYQTVIPYTIALFVISFAGAFFTAAAKQIAALPRKTR